MKRIFLFLLLNIYLSLFTFLLLSCDVKIQEMTPEIIDPQIHCITSGYHECMSPAWSPDGSRIAFIKINASQNLYAVDVATGEETGLFARIPEYFYGRMSLSPDYHSIVYQSTIRGNLCVYSLLDETNTQVTKEESPPSDPVWSADGSKIYYVSSDEDHNYYLKSISASGGNSSILATEKFIVDTTIRLLFWPTVSPDNQHIAFTRFKRDSARYHIAILDLNTRTITDITSDEYNDMTPAWSPDGNSIAFISSLGNRSVARVYNVHTGEINRLSLNFHGADPYSLCWSPDGSKLAMSRYSETIVYDIRKDEMTLIPLADVSPPLWLPDSKSLVVLTRRSYNYRLHAVTLSDTNDRQLTYHGTEFRDYFPNWSPDGEFIYFYRSSGELLKMNVAGGMLKKVYSGSMSSVELSKDGSTFIFERGGDINMLRIDGTHTTRLNIHNYRNYFDPCWGPDTTQFACCSYDSLLLFKIEKDSVIKQGGIAGSYIHARWSVEHPVFGSRIAAVRASNRYSNNAHIYIIDPETLEKTLCIENHVFPNWSPDGTQLTFTHRSGAVYYKKILYEF